MSDPLRYDPGCEPETLDAEAVMFQCTDGAFVKYSDYLALKADVDLLRKDRDLLFSDYKTALASIQRLHWELLTAKEGKTKP